MAENEAPERITARVCRCSALVIGINACPHCGAGWAQTLVGPTKYVRERAAPDAAQWSKEFPAESGHYWMRCTAGDNCLFIVKLEDNQTLLQHGLSGDCRNYIDVGDYEFLGPLQPHAADAVRQAREEAAKLIPTSWLDDLLTGPNAVIGKPPYDCQDIERLLRAIKERIGAAALRADKGDEDVRTK